MEDFGLTVLGFWAWPVRQLQLKPEVSGGGILSRASFEKFEDSGCTCTTKP